jgi:peptidoglycan/xylan/chitin deacetylase (PgdA/CDA1 family)
MSSFFILNYHHILPGWGFDVACRTLDFELAFLKTCFDVVPLDEICNLVTQGVTPRRTTVAVTFDDGCLDTFVYAYPLCKKHRIRAAIFPIASRIIDDERIRPTLEDYWHGKVGYRDLYQTVPISVSNFEYFQSGFSPCFMSAGELKKAAEIMDVGSHASVHAYAFYEDRIIDFCDGSKNQSCYFYAYEEDLVRGFPIFPARNNLAVRRGRVRDDVKAYVRSMDEDFFLRPNWKETLREDLGNLFSTLLIFESEAEQTRRVEEDLDSSLARLENILGAKPRFFAYPFGHHDPVSERAVADRFDAAFTTEIDVVRKRHKLHLLPRAKVQKDVFSFMARAVKFSRRG